DVLEVRRALARAGQHDRQRLILILRIEKDAEKIEDLLGGSGAAGEDHDAVSEAHEGFEALLDVRHDDELVDDRIRRLGGDDAGLREADVAAVIDALLGVTDGRALHRALHRPRSTAGADVQAAKPQFVADALAVLLFVGADRVTAPAYDQVGPRLVVEQARIAQHVEHRIGDVGGFRQVVAAAGDDLVGDEHHIAQHRKEMLLDATDHLPVDERRGRSVVDLELDAPRVAHDADVEIAIAVEDLLGVIGAGAAVEHGEGALAEELVEPSLTRVEQLLDLDLREVLEAAAGAHPGIDEFGNDEAAFHGYGRMSIGVPSCVSNQISTMSASETAMQPSVQSLCW